MDKGKKHVRDYVVWIDEMDEALLNIFVEHYNKGDRAQNGWKPHVYIVAIKNVHDKCSTDVTKDKIISRSKTFDKHYAIISMILSRSGFGWDWDKNKISVDSDDVWNNYVKDNKEASWYRHKVVKFWDSISLLYSRDHATGEGARTAAESAIEISIEGDGDGKESDSTTATSSTQTGDEHKRKRYRSDDFIACMLGKKLDSFTPAFKDDVSQAPKLAALEEILTALNAILELGEDDLLAAYDILISSDRKYMSLMALPAAMKKKWMKHIKQ